MQYFKITILFLAFFIICSLQAQAPGEEKEDYTPIKVTPALKSELLASSSGIRSLKAGFVQEKYISYLASTVVSEGTIAFKKPEKIRWQYSSPYEFTIVIIGEEFHVLDTGSEYDFKERENKRLEEMGAMIQQTLHGKIYEETSAYHYKTYSNATSYKFELTPKNEELLKLFTKLEIVVSQENFQPRSFRLFEPGGDITTIRLKSAVVNPELPDSFFSIR